MIAERLAMDREAKQRELAELRAKVQAVEAELASASVQEHGQWPPPGFYATYYVMGGCVLGMIGAATSLLFNVVGALVYGEQPLHLIQVYLTFPLGSRALRVDDGLTLAIGCCLYLVTGMILGVPFHIVLNRWFAKASFGAHFIVVSVMAIALWIINFYGILILLRIFIINTINFGCL